MRRERRRVEKTGYFKFRIYFEGVLSCRTSRRIYESLENIPLAMLILTFRIIKSEVASFNNHVPALVRLARKYAQNIEDPYELNKKWFRDEATRILSSQTKKGRKRKNTTNIPQNHNFNRKINDLNPFKPNLILLRKRKKKQYVKEYY